MPGRTSGHGCGRSPNAAQNDAPATFATLRSRACLTAFFVRFAPLPASRTKPSGTRASRDEAAVLTHTSFFKTFGPSALGNAH